MGKFSAWLLVLMLIVGTGSIAEAIPFSVVSDYGGSRFFLPGTGFVDEYQGEDFLKYIDTRWNPQEWNDSFTFPDVKPEAAALDSAFLSITHVGVQPDRFNNEIWVMTEDAGYNIGQLSVSGSPFGGTDPWHTDVFDLDDAIIAAITSRSPWELRVVLAETTNEWIPDQLLIDRVEFGGEYSLGGVSAPEPATILLIGTGCLIGFAVPSIRKKLMK